MQSFLLVAAAHFLALLLPGPDFLLITRLALGNGWRLAAWACLGIALANGLFIVLAFSGLNLLQPDSWPFRLLQAAGGLYLTYLGLLFLRTAGTSADTTAIGHSSAASVRHPSDGAPIPPSSAEAARMGLVSGLLNPKNALFYASLAAMLAASSPGNAWLAFYGLWMFGVVLGWDLLVVRLIGSRRVRQRYASWLPGLERLSGGLLGLLGCAMVWRAALPA